MGGRGLRVLARGRENKERRGERDLWSGIMGEGRAEDIEDEGNGMTGGMRG